MKFVLSSLIAAIFLSGCASNTTSQQNQTSAKNSNASSNYECPKTGAELDLLKSEEHVISCLGQPKHVTSKPDGRHTGLYDFKGGLSIVFLYGADQKVIRYRAYQDDLRK
jgi:hypothetical protein